MITVDIIIGKWPSAEHFSEDLGLKHRSHGRVMKVRGAIPAARWPKVLEAAKSRGIPLSEEDLAFANEHSPKPAKKTRVAKRSVRGRRLPVRAGVAA